MGFKWEGDPGIGQWKAVAVLTCGDNEVGWGEWDAITFFLCKTRRRKKEKTGKKGESKSNDLIEKKGRRHQKQ